MKTIQILTKDKFHLKANLFEPKETEKGVIMLCSGLGIPKEFYQRYASFLAQQGYIALIFDYRGIGSSLQNIGNTTTNLQDLGQQDMTAVADFLHQKYPAQKLHLIGHSVAGQVFGLMPNHQIFDSVIFICTLGGYCWDYPFPTNIGVAFLWYIHIPLITRLMGELPKGLTYRGVSIPKGIAQDWAKWSKQKKYVASAFGKTIHQEFYDDVTRKIHTIYFTDDNLATPKSIDRILGLYKNAAIQRHHINPSTYNLSKIGHSGFYSSKVGEPLWNYPLELLQ